MGYYYYDDPNGVAYGFLKDGENYTRIEYPGHPLTAYGRVTGINNNGRIVGYYYDPDTGEIISFLKDGENYTKIIPPVGWRIYAKGINNSGKIVGWAHTPEGRRAFLATPAPPADVNTPPIL